MLDFLDRYDKKIDDFVYHVCHKKVIYNDNELLTNKATLKEIVKDTEDVDGFICEYMNFLINNECMLGNYKKYVEEKTEIIEKYLIKNGIKFNKVKLKKYVNDYLVMVITFNEDLILNQKISFSIKFDNDVLTTNGMECTEKNVQMKIRDYFDFINNSNTRIICKID